MLLVEYLLAFGLGLAPSIVWLIFFEYEEAKHGEPISRLIYAFIIGSFTTFAALAVQLAVIPYFQAHAISQHNLLGISIFASIEEILKFLAVYFLIAWRFKFDEPLEAMIYMITVALGFAAVENIASLVNQGGLHGAVISAAALESIILRFLGATLLHSATSGIIGFQWAVGLVRKKYVWLHLMLGVVMASLLHSVFNYLIIMTGPSSWGLAFVVFISLFTLIDFEELRIEDESEHAMLMKASENIMLK